MGKIALICAAPPGTNPGMASVDLAMAGLCRRRAIAADVEHLVLYLPHEMTGAGTQSPSAWIKALNLRYACFRDRLERLAEADAIVFWGDFLHALDYHQIVADMLVKAGLAADEAAAGDLLRRHLFLGEQEDALLARTLVYGGTLLFNHAQSLEQHPRYSGDLARFMGRVRQVWMREVYSAFAVSRMRAERGAAALGTDCAMLLDDADVARLPAGPWGDQVEAVAGKVGVFFGRAMLDAKLMGRFAGEVCRKLDRPAVWLPWGDGTAFQDMRQRTRRGLRGLGGETRDQPPAPGDLLRMVANCRLVISDTYHLCLNAWRMGVPAVCIGQALMHARFNINSGYAFAWRDKRQVLYAMYDAMPWYVYGDELTDRAWRNRRVFQLSSLLTENSAAAAVTRRMHEHRAAAEAELATALRGLLEAGHPR